MSYAGTTAPPEGFTPLTGNTNTAQITDAPVIAPGAPSTNVSTSRVDTVTATPSSPGAFQNTGPGTSGLAPQGMSSGLYNTNAAAGTAGSLAPEPGTVGQPPQSGGTSQTSSTTAPPTTSLQPGAQGQDVTGLQNYLASLGYLTPQQIATGPGIYGPQTQAAVAKLQKDLGIDAGGGSGSYGPQTQAALAKKYQDAHNNITGEVPNNPASASSALEQHFGDNPSTDTGTEAQQAYFEKLFGLNPVESMIFSQLSSLMSQTGTQTSLVDLYKQESEAQGLPELNLQLADINSIMRGTEDDIRNEITAGGGGGTESQVAALTGARNKVLMNKAQYLTDVINSKNDYVDKVVQLTGEDRAQVSKDIETKLGIANAMETITTNAETAAKDNFKSVIDAVGWDGLAASVKDNPTQQANIEKLFGLSPGELQSIAAYNSPQEQQQALQMQNLQLQNKKLQQDLTTGPAVSTQVVDLGGKKVLINSKTGQVISEITAGANTPSPQAMALQQQNIQDTQSLLKNPALAAAVGPNNITRGELPIVGGNYSLAGFTGGKSNFIAGVQQLQQSLTLSNLQNAKQNGATFGALSEGELNLLSQSSSKLGSWAIKDKAGNVLGYDIDEKDFKSELDKINNFQKLDFVLKGGDAASVGVQQMPDGTLWTENSDGSKTQIQ